MTTVHVVLNSTLPALPSPTSPSPSTPVHQNQYNFIGTSHLQFQWGPCTYAWGRVAAPETTTSKSGCLTPGPRPYLYRCVELQTGRWVAAAQPLRAFRKLGYIDVCDSALQHVLVASAFKVLDMGLPK